MRHELICLAPATPPRLQRRNSPLPQLRPGQVLVQVEATSINPIDAKRASGYGQRLLALKGAAAFPLVLGNDLVGRVEQLAPGCMAFQPGQRVFGLVGTGKGGGAHATHVAVAASLLQPASDTVDSPALAVLPYSFTTMWQAVRAVRLTPATARDKRVLVHGAAGALGRLALQLLSGWGCQVTALCAVNKADECHALGASTVLERSPHAIHSLPTDFDAVLNFASWDDELALASRLDSKALGHATTVHPLLGHFDRLGWLRGALACRRDAKAMRSAVQQRAPAASYNWTVFKPDPEALAALAAGMREQRFRLPVGISTGFAQADAAFAHVASGLDGRAVLLP